MTKKKKSTITASAKIRYRKFVDALLETGNQRQAAIKAGYSPINAANQAGRLLKNAYVLEYREKREQEMESAAIAKPQEVLPSLTAGMRGEIKDQFDLDPSFADRTECAKQLQKRYGLDKLAVIGGEDGDNPLQVESAVKIYIPDNSRDDGG